MADEEYETKDLYFAAFLALHVEPRGTSTKEEWNPRKKKNTLIKYFLFRSEPTIPDLKVQYFSGRAQVSALAYADSVRNMKTLLYV
ncbi:MAG: hypothetical protein Q8P59_01965 [Dehalococcoidia bacterium]|nr:hypothetical protein [Dehalococcoidia bacterium]